MLTAPSGQTARPTTDRIRESLFNVLTHSDHLPNGFDGVRVLDLFAGTGALGLEALSRGAAFALFVENAGACRAAIRQNIETLALMGQTKIFRRDATALGPRPANVGAAFDLVFLDPPYGLELGPKAIFEARNHNWLAPDALIVFEMAKKEATPVLDGFKRIDERLYGDSKIVFYTLT